MGVRHSKPSIFVLQNTNTQDLPIHFSEDLISKLQTKEKEREIKAVKETSVAKVEGDIIQLDSRFKQY